MKELVVKDNALINASYNLDLVEQRLILLAIVEARETGKGINTNDPLTVHAESYVKTFGVHRNTAYQALKDACNDLFARQFSYQTLSEKGNPANHKSRWVSEIAYVENEAVVKLIFSPAIVPLITRLEEHFTKYELQQVSQLSSAYAVRLYELLIAWRSTGQTPIIKISDFRERIGVLENEYKRMERFKTSVLEMSIEQINRLTDITVQYEQHKEGRTIVGFSFRFKHKNDSKLIPKEKNVGDNKENIPELFNNMTEKQLTFFSSKLTAVPDIQAMAEPGEEMSDFSKRIKAMLQDPSKQKKLHPYLKEIGFNSK